MRSVVGCSAEDAAMGCAEAFEAHAGDRVAWWRSSCSSMVVISVDARYTRQVRQPPRGACPTTPGDRLGGQKSVVDRCGRRVS